ncbi:heterokaryon incompatibility protein-domain-containing protein [Leptodontidium sp. 2 PMI_412]|nr:heterokaryon incompatibility protein-domain-containing protein [Leptodontidium sp. 2 PMI_412]
MRLLNTQSFTLRVFSSIDLPDYAILSHTWTGNEIIFQDFVNGHIEDENVRLKKAFPKIYGACIQAASDEYEWIWIDSLCIDKSSSSELQEAINSMWNWYKNAGICYAYLEDIPNETVGWNKGAFQRSRWFTRGWTLQELIAPFYVTFYSADWKSIGTKLRRIDEIHEVTGITKTALETGNIANHHAAEVMSWAAHREVSRDEDAAYSLLGLFDINMPMLYGEGGTKAFLRLQEAIYRYWADDTLFLWTYTGSTELPAMLAEHPHQFCRTIGSCSNHNRPFGLICFPKDISYQSIRPIQHSSPKLTGPGFGQELVLRRQGVRANMVIIERDQESALDHLRSLIIIHRGFTDTKRDEAAPKASAVAVLDVMDPQDRLYCLEMGSAQLPNTFQRLPTIGLVPLATDFPGRVPINIYTPPQAKFGSAGVVHCLSLQFKSDYFPLHIWQPSRTLEVYGSLDEEQITINSDLTEFDCSLVTYDPLLRDREIIVGLAHRGLENGNFQISSVTVEDRGIIDHQTLSILSTDQYQLDLSDGSSVLISARQLPHLAQDEDDSMDKGWFDFRYQIQMTRIGPENK